MALFTVQSGVEERRGEESEGSSRFVLPTHKNA
jgi:hypothetical protein